MYSPLTKQLIEALQKLPGIGQKSAQRMAFKLLTDAGKIQANHLSNMLTQATNAIGYCKSCRHFTESDLCPICANAKRQTDLVCIVESPADLVAINQTNQYNGVFYVLHGRLSPLDGIGPSELGLEQMFERFKTSAVKEAIIATNSTMEGEATAYYIAAKLKSLNIKASRIAHGVPIGGELEYLDGNTLAHAFGNRAEILMNDD